MDKNTIRLEVVSYDPMNDEVDISTVNEWVKNTGAKVIIFDQKLTEVPTFDDAQIICIVPGRAFTKDGKRLGRGIGFYDRLLEKNSQMTAIGVCFSTQIYEDLPEDTWDKRVEKVVIG
jgi:hypothetical protein